MTKERSLSLLYLGFDENANPTEKEIQDAYKRVAKILHPDGSGSNEQFRGLTIARDVLLECAPKKKQAQKQPQQKQTYTSYSKGYSDEDIKRLNNKICETLSEALEKLPRRVYYIGFTLQNASASVKITDRKFTTIEISGTADAYDLRIHLYSKVSSLRDHAEDWKLLKHVGINVRAHSKFAYWFRKFARKLP